MDPWSTETTEDDMTLRLLRTVNDGSMKGLAQFHLLKMQLESIRNLPERSDDDRNVPPR